MTAQEQIDKWRREGAYHSDYMYEDKGKIFGKYVGEIRACQYCGKPSGLDAKCTNCWEMVSRIESITDISVAHKIKNILDKRISEL